MCDVITSGLARRINFPLQTLVSNDERRQSLVVVSSGTQQFPRLAFRKEGIEMKAWFLWMSFVRALLPSLPAFTPHDGEDTKTSPRWQRTTYRRSLLTLSVVESCFAAVRYGRVKESYGTTPEYLSLNTCRLPPRSLDVDYPIEFSSGTHLELESKFRTCLELREMESLA